MLLNMGILCTLCVVTAGYLVLNSSVCSLKPKTRAFFNLFDFIFDKVISVSNYLSRAMLWMFMDGIMFNNIHVPSESIKDDAMLVSCQTPHRKPIKHLQRNDRMIRHIF